MWSPDADPNPRAARPRKDRRLQIGSRVSTPASVVTSEREIRRVARIPTLSAFSHWALVDFPMPLQGALSRRCLIDAPGCPGCEGDEQKYEETSGWQTVERSHAHMTRLFGKNPRAGQLLQDNPGPLAERVRRQPAFTEVWQESGGCRLVGGLRASPPLKSWSIFSEYRLVGRSLTLCVEGGLVVGLTTPGSRQIPC